MRALRILPRLEDIVPLPDLDRLANERVVLVRDAHVVGLYGGEPARVVLVEDGDDRVLRDVLDGVGRGIDVGDLGVLVVLAPPLVRGGHGLVDEGAAEVEGVAGFVDHDGQHVVLWIEEGHGAWTQRVSIVGKRVRNMTTYHQIQRPSPLPRVRRRRGGSIDASGWGPCQIDGPSSRW